MCMLYHEEGFYDAKIEMVMDFVSDVCADGLQCGGDGYGAPRDK